MEQVGWMKINEVHPLRFLTFLGPVMDYTLAGVSPEALQLAHHVALVVHPFSRVILMWSGTSQITQCAATL